MPDFLEATTEMAAEYARWFVNRLAYTRQSDTPNRDSGRHYYYRPKKKGRALKLHAGDIQRHLAGEMTVGLYAINPRNQRVKWMAIDADYGGSLEDLLKLQYELGQDGIQAVLEQSRRGGHLWVFFEMPVLARRARVYVRHLATRLSVQVKGAGPTEGIELFPKQDSLEEGQFGNAIRGPLGVHRGAGRRYWFYGAAYDLEAQMAYLRSLRRVSEQQLDELVGDLPYEPEENRPQRPRAFDPERPHFQILQYIETRRRVGRNWVTQCPSCAAAGRDRAKDNLAVSIKEPWKYLCWAGCTKEQIRAAVGAPVPIMATR
jgi:hypothetical protein